MQDAISILVITRERPDLLANVLSDLRKQIFHGRYEIVVVEETDTPHAPEGVVYVPHPVKNLGIAYARNLSVAHASHDILVFIDDDCRVEQGWLATLVLPLQDSNVLGVQGGVVVPSATNATGWAESLLGFPGGGFTRVYQARGRVQETLELSTLNACYRKAAVLKAGGFSEHARFGGEDYLLAKKVAEHGKLLFVPQAIVRHEARGSITAIWTWFVRRGRAEFDVWQAGVAPQGFAGWMVRSSLSVKLLPFVMLTYWYLMPLLGVILLMMIVNMWRFKWVLTQKNVPFQAWLLLPWVKFVMGLATDVGRFKAWVSKS